MPHARTTDPITSHQAAASVTNLSATKNFILWLFDKFAYLTDEELYAHYCRYMASGDAPKSGRLCRPRRVLLLPRLLSRIPKSFDRFVLYVVFDVADVVGVT